MAVIYHRHQAASQNSKSCLSAYLCVCVSEKETEQTCAFKCVLWPFYRLCVSDCDLTFTFLHTKGSTRDKSCDWSCTYTRSILWFVHLRPFKTFFVIHTSTTISLITCFINLKNNANEIFHYPFYFNLVIVFLEKTSYCTYWIYVNKLAC